MATVVPTCHRLMASTQGMSASGKAPKPASTLSGSPSPNAASTQDKNCLIQDCTPALSGSADVMVG